MVIVYVTVERWVCYQIAFIDFDCCLKFICLSFCAHAMFKDRLYLGNVVAQYLVDTTSNERDCPLNLSISLSGEKENNNDS